MNGSCAVALIIGFLQGGDPVQPPASSAGQRYSIAAQEWINPLHLRYPEDRTWVILFFTTRPPKGTDLARFRRELEQSVARLNRLASERKDLLVLGLTEQPREELKGFLDELKPRFPIGSRSLSHRSFSLKSLPAVVTLSDAPPRELPIQEDWGSLIPARAVPSKAIIDEGSVEELKTAVTKDPSALALAFRETGEFPEALEVLRLRMDPAEFLALCDSLEPLGDVVWVGRIRYQKHLADPTVLEKLPYDTPASEAAGDWRRSRDDPRWAPMRSFFEEFEARPSVTVESVVEAHQAHLTDDPNDLLIRFWLAQSVRDRKNVALLPALRAIYDAEPDAVVRSQILLGMCQLAPTGDAETLGFLEERSRTETHFRTSATLDLAARAVRQGLDHP